MSDNSPLSYLPDFKLVPCEAEPSFPVLKIQERFNKMLFCEIGPQHICYIYLGIGHLPEKKIAYSELAARPYEKIRVRTAGSIEMPCEKLLCDIVYINPALFYP